MTLHSSLSVVSGSGTLPAFSNSTPLWISSVASPPSSTIWLGPWPSPKSRARSVHHQYSSRVSPFQAKTGMPAGSFDRARSGADRHGGGGVVLRAEDVARAPPHLGAQGGQRLDQHGGLDRHVQAAHDPQPLERLLGGVLLADRHQAGHLLLGQHDLLAAPVGQRQVGHFEFKCRGANRRAHPS